MEPTSPPDRESPHAHETLTAQVREMYGRVAYTHKTHEKMADSCIRRHRAIKVVEITLSSLATGSLLLAVFGDSRIATILGALLSTVLLGIALYFKEAALGEEAHKHTVAASKLWGIREQLLSLLVDIKDQRNIEEARKRRDAANEALQEIYQGAPRTAPRAYAAAQQALKVDEELYFSDEELDHLLPKKLRDAERDASTPR